MAEHAARERLEKMLGSSGPDIGCEACFEELDRYVELDLRRADAERAVPGMRRHLEDCPACGEEYESLRALLEG